MTKLILLLVFATSCHAQTRPQQEAAPNRPQKDTASGIQIIATGKAELDFSTVNGQFNKVYGNVHNGFSDKAGNLWFGTTGAGGVMYNGNYFTHFTNATPLLEDKQGNIWLATADGLYSYNGTTFARLPFTTAAKNDLLSFTPNAPANKNAAITVTTAMQDRQGRIWLATEQSGVYYYDGTGFTRLAAKKGIINTSGLRLNAVQNMLEDRNGNIWFASWNNEGLCRYDGSTLTNYTPKNGLGDNMVYSLLEDAAGNIWIGTRDHGVWRYNGSTFTNLSAHTDLQNQAVYAIRQDASGNVWLATESTGVWRYDGKSFTNFTTKDGLSNNSVFCIVADGNGQLWFGTRGMGLCRYDGNTFSNFTKPGQ